MRWQKVRDRGRQVSRKVSRQSGNASAILIAMQASFHGSLVRLVRARDTVRKCSRKAIALGFGQGRLRSTLKQQDSRPNRNNGDTVTCVVTLNYGQVAHPLKGYPQFAEFFSSESGQDQCFQYLTLEACGGLHQQLCTRWSFPMPCSLRWQQYCCFAL